MVTLFFILTSMHSFFVTQVFRSFYPYSQATANYLGIFVCPNEIACNSPLHLMKGPTRKTGVGYVRGDIVGHLGE